VLPIQILKEIHVFRLAFRFALLLALFSSLALADQITLKNGDKITGSIVKSDGKTLVLHTASLGDVTINYGDIAQITTDQPLHVTANGQTTVGTVTTNDSKIEITTKTGNVEAPKDSVTLIRNDAEQAAYDKSLHPGMMKGWNGGLNVGFSLARGNNQTENLNLALNAVHPTLNDKITLYSTSVYSKNDAPGATPSVIANLITGGIRYDRNLSPRTFVFVGADFMADALQGLNLRSVFSAGLGFHAIKSANTTLDLLAGGNYSRSSFVEYSTATPPVRSIITQSIEGLTLGEELNHVWSKSTTLTQRLFFYPGLNDTSNYRGEFDLGTVTKIGKHFGWQNQFTDLYAHPVPAGKHQNDVIFSTGLNFSFAN
jgi:putative salt-induced outer membrane protein YdiY